MLVGQVWSRGRMFPTLVHSLRHGPLCKAVTDDAGGRGWRVEGGEVSRRLARWPAVGGAAGGNGSTGQALALAG